MTSYLFTIAIFTIAFLLASCASHRDTSMGQRGTDGINQNTNAAMVYALSGIGK